MSAFDNYKRQVNNGKNDKYLYLTSTTDIYEKFMQQHHDMNYALKKERSRDRFVANRKGLENAIVQTINKVLLSEMDEIADIISQDVIYKVQNAFGGVGGTKVNKNSFSSKLGKMLGKALADIPFKLWEEIDKDTR